MTTVDGPAVDGVVAERVVCPETAERFAEALAEASRQAWPTVIRGGGTKIGWGRRPARVGLVVDTTALNRVVTHRHGDLIATVQAGARIGQVNATLAQHRQWLPIDAPDGATIGGVLATNDAGPLRHRHGTPRDQLIGITLAMTDGRLVKAGGEVVKNVAGYDLGKLVCGSHGSLAGIATATFKLAPLPAVSRTLIARFVDPASAATAIEQIAASQLEPIAFDLHAGADADGAHEVWVRVASTVAAVEAQLRRLEQICAAANRTVVEGEADRQAWHDRSARIWRGAGALVRLSWLPADAGALMALLPGLDAAEGARVSWSGRASVGAGLMRIDGSLEAQHRVIERLRAVSTLARHVVVLRAEPSLKDRLDVWGDLGDAATALQALKRAFDPAGVLNAGRGPI